MSEGVLKYDEYIPKHSIRLNLYKKFFYLLKHLNIKYQYNFLLDDIQKMALNIERGINNKAIIYNNNSISEWDWRFKHNYGSIAVRIFSNLNSESYLHNENLIHRFFQKTFNEFELIDFDAKTLFPEKYEQLLTECQSLEPKYSKPLTLDELPDGAFKCGKCKSWKTQYTEIQQRSSDEPTNKRVFCHKCGHRWKFC